MKDDRTAATLVGILYIIGTAAGMASLFPSQGISGAPESLAALAADPSRVIVTGSLILAMAVALAIIPAVIYPILKRESEVLAVGYVIFRGALEVPLLTAGALGWLALPVIARLAADASGAAASQYAVLATLSLKMQGPTGGASAVAFAIGGMMLYYAMLRARLVPRWLSVWGLGGCVLYLIAGAIGTFAVAPMLLYMPILVQEMVMAAWLIAKGFNSRVSAEVMAPTTLSKAVTA